MTKPIVPNRWTPDGAQVQPGQQGGHATPGLDASLVARRQSLHFSVLTLVETDIRARKTPVDAQVRTSSTGIPKSGAA